MLEHRTTAVFLACLTELAAADGRGDASVHLDHVRAVVVDVVAPDQSR